MDDSERMSAQFQLGDRVLTIKRPTDAQMMVLMMSRRPTDGDIETATRLVQKTFRVLENVAGTDVYYNVIEDGLINEEFTHTQVLELVSKVITHDWTAPTGDALQEALDREEARQMRYETVTDVQLPAYLSPQEIAMIERMRNGGQSQ